MIPVYIPKSLYEATHEEVIEKLDYYAYKFTVLATLDESEDIKNLIKSLELYTLVALRRVIKNELGYFPKQNKIFERVEAVFGDQDAYNINRMLSSLRRAKMFGVDPADEKYIKWFENRVHYAIKAIKGELEQIVDEIAEDVVVEHYHD